MTHGEKTRVINQYRHDPVVPLPPSVDQMYVWLMNAMWLAVTNPKASKKSIVAKSSITATGVIIK